MSSSPPLAEPTSRHSAAGALTALPSAVAAAAIVGLYLLDALVIRPSKDVPYCAVTGLARLAHWDGGWYASIATVGYQRHAGIQQPSAFFPLFPLLARAGHTVIPVVSLTAAGIAMNVVATVAAMVLVDRTLEDWPTWQRVGCVLILLVLPGAYFYVAFYSEALFALSVALFVWALRSGKLWVAVFAVVMASLDRTIGVALVFPLSAVAFRDGDRRRAAVMVAASFGGLAALGVYVVATGKVALFRAGRAGWRGASGLSYPVYLLRHGVAVTFTLVKRAALFRPVDKSIPSIGGSVVWGLGLWADAAIVAVGASLAYARRTATYVLWPGIALGAVTIVAGPAISQERFAMVLLPLWVGVIAALRGSRLAWGVLAVAGAGSLVLNLHLLGQFASCRWAG